jgi:hypothetical protein
MDGSVLLSMSPLPRLRWGAAGSAGCRPRLYAAAAAAAEEVTQGLAREQGGRSIFRELAGGHSACLTTRRVPPGRKTDQPPAGDRLPPGLRSLLACGTGVSPVVWSAFRPVDSRSCARPGCRKMDQPPAGDRLPPGLRSFLACGTGVPPVESSAGVATAFRNGEVQDVHSRDTRATGKTRGHPGLR